MWMILLLGMALMVPGVSVWPATTAPIISSQFARLNGYGMSVAAGDVRLEYYRASYTSKEPGKLLHLVDGVSERDIDLWEVNCSVYKNRGFSLGAGLNKAESKLGWQIYAENNFGGFAYARLGFRRVWIGKEVDGIVASFGIDVIKCAKTFWRREVRGETLSQLEK